MPPLPPRLLPTLLASLWAASPGLAFAVEPPTDAAAASEAAPVETVPVGVLRVSLTEALEIALVRSYAIQAAQLDLDTSKSRIEEAWGTVYPRVDLDARYTRNVRVANPFAGSSAGGFFGGLDAIGWLAYNEGARQSGQPTLDLLEYQNRVAGAQRAAGLAAPDPNANPFLVENAVSATLSIKQTLYNGAAFAAIRGAESYRAQVESQVRDAQQRVARQVATAYLGAQLAAAQVRVIEQSVARTRLTAEEIGGKVEQGVLPKFQSLSAEVELANLETRLLQAKAAEQSALDGLKVAVGLPPDTEIALRERLDPELNASLPAATASQALDEAIERRADLEGLRKRRATAAVSVELAEASYLPVVSFFANIGIQASIPDDREVGTADPQNPFLYSREVLSPFDGAYWYDTFNLGLSLTWNLFDGFQTSEKVQQARVDTRRLEVQYAQTLDTVRNDLRVSMRDLRTARDRMAAVVRTLDLAQLNYDHTKARVDEGVSTPLELREASQQLDETGFNRVQAVHDYLEALVRYRVAVGAAPGELPGSMPTADDAPLKPRVAPLDARPASATDAPAAEPARTADPAADRRDDARSPR